MDNQIERYANNKEGEDTPMFNDEVEETNVDEVNSEDEATTKETEDQNNPTAEDTKEVSTSETNQALNQFLSVIKKEASASNNETNKKIEDLESSINDINEKLTPLLVLIETLEANFMKKFKEEAEEKAKKESQEKAKKEAEEKAKKEKEAQELAEKEQPDEETKMAFREITNWLFERFDTIDKLVGEIIDASDASDFIHKQSKIKANAEEINELSDMIQSKLKKVTLIK